ncbi:MAG TPA: hypothetical protein VK588_12775 [Chitinophagaceae bacterium]|nr:hypothetical protein [Chitinophagaceae bacterium]
MQKNLFWRLFSLLLMVFLFTACKSKIKSADPSTVPKDEQVKKESESTKSDTAQTDTTTSPPIVNNVSNELSFLSQLNGKYPYEVKLLDNAVLKRRLKKMLGARFEFLKSIWQTETPIEISNNLFYAWAMQAHSGGDPGAVLMADLAKNVLYAGIKENGHTKIYSEDGSKAPQKLQDWSVEK